MNSLQVLVNRKAARANAWFLLVVTSALILCAAILSAFGKVDWGGPMTWLLCVLIFGWMFLTLISLVLRLFRLSKLEGPILELKQDGCIDNWSNPTRFLSWEQIEYSEWRNAKFTRVFRIVLKEQSILKRIQSIIGIRDLEFPEQYLSVSAREIAEFMLKNAPEEILR